MNRLVAILLICASFLLSQTDRGSLTGTVVDSSGGTVSEAKVTITNIGTNEVRRLSTSAIGAFAANDLEPARWIPHLQHPSA